LATVSTAFKGRKGKAMNSMISKLSLAAAAVSLFLTVSPAHANLAVPVLNQPIPRTDLSMLESLKPITISGDIQSHAAPSPDTELSAKLNQMAAIRHLMRSA
jgi:hypothetical protein